MHHAGILEDTLVTTWGSRHLLAYSKFVGVSRACIRTLRIPRRFHITLIGMSVCVGMLAACVPDTQAPVSAVAASASPVQPLDLGKLDGLTILVSYMDEDTASSRRNDDRIKIDGSKLTWQASEVGNNCKLPGSKYHRRADIVFMANQPSHEGRVACEAEHKTDPDHDGEFFDTKAHDVVYTTRVSVEGDVLHFSGEAKESSDLFMKMSFGPGFIYSAVHTDTVEHEIARIRIAGNKCQVLEFDLGYEKIEDEPGVGKLSHRVVRKRSRKAIACAIVEDDQ